MAGHERPGPTVPLEEARRQLLSSLNRLAPRSVPLDQALGAVVAAPVIAAEDVPAFTNAAMDGYAVRAEDAREAPCRLRIVGEVTAGHSADAPLGPGQAMVITTGAPMPPGSDAICMIEYTTLEGDNVVLEAAVRTGQHVRYAGEDVSNGNVVCDSGIEIRPVHIGVLASIGVLEVIVYPRGRVGVLSTGDEIRMDPGPLGRGQIRDSNRHALLALVRTAGCDPVDLGVVGDDESGIAAAIEGAARDCDAVITSGGVSMGVADHMKTVLGRLSGGSAHWMEVAIKPGKPFGFATIGPGDTPVLCMPGNPVSAMVSFELLARSALRFMMGHTVLERPRLIATVEKPLVRHPDGKLHLVRVVVSVGEGRLLARPVGGQGSHQLRSMALANALAFLPDGKGIDAGETVPVMLLEPDAVPATESGP